MNIGLERPIGLEAGHTYHIRLVVDDTSARCTWMGWR